MKKEGKATKFSPSETQKSATSGGSITGDHGLAPLGCSLTGNQDTIRFGAGIASSAITFARSGYDIILGINATSDQIKVLNWGAGDTCRVERVEFADGTVWDSAYLQIQTASLLDMPIVGTIGYDYMQAWVGENSTLQGLGGNDQLIGSNGNDILDGGTGNDMLQGGAGNDTYLFNLGGGQDTIYENAGNVDTLRFGEGIVAGDITFNRSGSDLILGINGTSEQVRIQNWGAGDAYRIERVEFNDGTVWDAADMQSQIAALPIVGTDGNEYLYAWSGENATIQGLGGNDYLYGSNGNDMLDSGPGNDMLQGGAGNDTYLFNLGGGQDTIYDNDSTAGNLDTLRFGEGIAASDITFARSGYDLVLGINGTSDQVKIQYWGQGAVYRIERVEFNDGTIWDAADIQSQITSIPVIGTTGNDTLQAWPGTIGSVFHGLEGDDFVNGTNGNDTLDGGAGNDTLSGGAGNDIYLFNLGDGQDTISDYGTSAGNLDTIKFGAGIATGNITFARSGNDLVLGINGTNDQVKMQNWGQGASYRIERVEFTDGTAWGATYLQTQLTALLIVGTSGNDYLYGDIGNENLEGGAGNDYLQGSTGNDTYLFNLGDGQDTISDYDSTAGNLDIIRFGEGIGAADITFARSGNDLVLGINGTSDQVKIRNWGYGESYYIEKVEFADSTVWGAVEIQTQTVGLLDLPIVGTGGNDTLQAWSGENATLQGLIGNDTLSGNNGNDTLDGGTGNDYLQGGIGNDTYLFNLGDGQDTIYDYGGNLDTIKFGAGIATGDITFARSGNDLALGINGTSDQVKIQNWGQGAAYRIERVEFTDGTVWDAADVQSQLAALPIAGTTGNDYLYGDAGNDTLDGGAGNDYLQGGVGNDTYLFNLGDGQDTISDYDYSAGNLDTIKFGAGIVTGDITFARSGNDLILGINGTSDQVKIQNWGQGASYRIERVEFADGTVWDAAYLQAPVTLPIVGTDGDDSLFAFPGESVALHGLGGNDYLRGNTGNDTLDGGVGNDSLFGGAGDDVLKGGAGNDYLYGGTDNDYADNGNDTYFFELGDGQDTIYDRNSTAGNLDTIKFGAGIAAGDIIFTFVENDLIIGINGTSDQVKIQNWVNGATYHIERVELDGGTVWDAAYIQSQIYGTSIVGTDGNDSLQAQPGEASFLQGLGGNDKLSGSRGNDTLDGGAGNDKLEGGAGNDALDGGADNDKLDGGTGDDTLNGGAGNDTLEGGAGNDTLDGGADNDKLDGGTGDDTLNGGAGSDTLEGGAGNDTLDGGADDDKLDGGTGHDTLNGGAGNDTLEGGAANDTLDGGAGNDTLDGGTGDDILQGGVGSDSLQGGAGDDIYRFNLGDGTDTISNLGTTGFDTVVFGAGIGRTSVGFFRDGNNLEIGYSDFDRVSVSNFFSKGNYAVDEIKLADGSSLAVADINQIIPDMDSYAMNEGIALSSVNDVRGNDQLMSIIATSWWT